MGALEAAALDLAGRGWPVFPCKPKAKEPLTAHGVLDATTNSDQIRTWWRRWRTANLGVACGMPGPTVLDIDRPNIARHALEPLGDIHAPTVATARGRHLYFAGEQRGTVSFDYGELRGTGSYVIAPPSTHPSGKLYIWTLAPTGPLPRLPKLFTQGRAATTAGQGAFEPPAEMVKHGARHDFLKDIAVRTVRTGITDVPTLILILQAAYETHCTKRPKAKPSEFTALAEWAAGTDIADRERGYAQAEVDAKAKAEEKPKKKPAPADALDKAPRGDAPLAEHRAYLRIAGGWGPHVDINDVRRHGSRSVDGLEIELNNGLIIEFDRQDQVTTRGHWTRTVIADTDGIASPPSPFKDFHLERIYRSLCILAGAPQRVRDREDLEDAVGDFLSLCEPLTGHNLDTPGGRYDATARCRARDAFDPRRHSTEDANPALLVDAHEQRYIRAGELRDYLAYRGLGISSAALPGRMGMLGYPNLIINGREDARPDREGPRRTNRMRLYQVPRGPGED